MLVCIMCCLSKKVLHLAGFAFPGIQCPLISKVCRLDFLLLGVKKASTVEVSLLLGDCQSLLCEAFEFFRKVVCCLSTGLENFLEEKTSAKLANLRFHCYSLVLFLLWQWWWNHMDCIRLVFAIIGDYVFFLVIKIVSSCDLLWFLCPHFDGRIIIFVSLQIILHLGICTRHVEFPFPCKLCPITPLKWKVNHQSHKEAKSTPILHNFI